MNSVQKTVWPKGIDCLLANFVKMTRNQSRVFTWLLSRANGRRETRCSARTIALKFNWSDAYAARFLQRMVDDELLEILLKGTGQKPNLYRLEKINLSNVVIKRKKKSVIPSLPQSLRANARRGMRISDEHTVLISDQHHSKITPAGATMGDTIRLLRREGPKIAMAKAIRSPFNRFEKKKHNPSSWNAQDIVCYYSLLFRHVYGHFPVMRWSTEVGAARNLLNYFSLDAEQVKHYLQIAFGQIRKGNPPGNLNAFTQQWVIHRATEAWDNDTLISDYQDRDVLAEVV